VVALFYFLMHSTPNLMFGMTGVENLQ